MLGILCSNEKEKKYAESFCKILREGFTNYRSIVVFTISNIDFINRRICGSLVTHINVEPIETELPSIIFNFSFQNKSSDVKKLRYLREMEEVFVINESNRFNQIMIMQIISSSSAFHKYILPYKSYKKTDIDLELEDNSNFLIVPEKGSNNSNVIFIKKLESMIKVYYKNKTQKYTKGKIRKSDLELKKSNYILLEAPKLKLYKNHPYFVRVYIQRGKNGKWKDISKNIYLEEKNDCYVFDENLSSISLEITNYISKFIPDMGICFVDFLYDIHDNPYILHFGGWDYRILLKKHSKEFYRKFLTTLYGYEEYCRNQCEGGLDYVDKDRSYSKQSKGNLSTSILSQKI